MKIYNGGVSFIYIFLKIMLQTPSSTQWIHLKVHKIENFFDSDFGICVISLLVMSKY